MSSNTSSANGIMNAATAGSAKGAKKVTKKTEEVAAPVAAAPAAAPVAEKKAPKAKAAKAEAAPAPAAPAPVAATPAPAAEPAAEEPRLEDEVKAVTAALLAVREQVSKLVTESKRLEKRAAKLQKLADKRRRRRAAAEAGADGKPARTSIFLVPTPLSKELCAFLGRPAGSQESRSNVTKAITTYVKENNLKNKHDINADAKLKGLLGLKEGDKLTYFNLQKYLNHHYIKTPAATA